MNDTVGEKLRFPSTSTGEVFARYWLVGINAASTEKASRLGGPIATDPPHEDEIAFFDQPLWPRSEDETWVKKNRRRIYLINKKHGRGLSGLTPLEAAELRQLQEDVSRRVNAMAPLPEEPLEALEALARRLEQRNAR